MWKKIKMSHHTFSLMLLVVVMCGSSCKDAKPNVACSYRLSRGGYSPSAHTFLFVVTVDRDVSLKAFGLGEKASWLATYNKEKRTVMYLLYPTDSSPFDFAWAPGQAVFVVTDFDRMTLFHKDASDDGYSGMAIQCPVNFMYTSCSWNSTGELLAVNCYDLERAFNNKLGLYDLKEEKFVLSDIVIDHRPFVWENDTTLLVTNHDKIVEVSLESGTPKLERTVPIEGGLTFFYGMFDGQALVLKGKEIKLGNRTLAVLGRNTRFGVSTTKKAIFVSDSSTNLIVYDHKGHEINKTNPGSTIHLGSIGEDPNTVYGLSGSMIMRISIENGSLNIHEVCDLANYTNDK
ncbi:MAG: hypothetical protein GY774_14645 [Planctomycetes bacterium]|nr:hypothetical protein [Planctomycetota bacterium]